jgi:hypothetical protein
LNAEATLGNDVVDPLKSVADAMSSAAEAMRDGAQDAADKVQQAIPAANKFVSRFVYSSCYFLSYGVVFPTLFAAHYVPGGGPVGAGIIDGANAANDAIKDIKVKRLAAKERAEREKDEQRVLDEGLECSALV